jgi:alpha-maltose-1-phosphate synthase
VTILVTNAGTHPEPAQIAAAFAGHGKDVRYLSTLSWSSDGRVATFAEKDTPISRLLRQRLLPEALSVGTCQNLALPLALAAELALRTSPDRGRVWLERRNRRFSTRAAAVVKAIVPTVLVAQQTNADVIFQAAGAGTVKILNYPIAHHRELLRLMSEERTRWSAWPDMAQGSAVSQTRLSQLDREVELADRILVASSFSRQSFIDAGIPMNKITCIPLGVDESQFNQINSIKRSESSRPRCKGELKILFVGQANQRKGFIDLLDAMSRVRTHKLRLTIVGAAGATARDIARHYNQDVVFAGTQPKSLLGRHFRDADLFVLPSVVEGFGLSALEAMAAGTPVLVSDHTFGADIIDSGENGFVVPSRDPGALALLLKEVASGDSLSLDKIGSRGAETARAYGWDSYRANVYQNFSDVVV